MKDCVHPFVTRQWTLLAAALLPVVPFLFTPIPPLTDVPGHIGRMAVQVAPPGDGLPRFFGFRWSFTPNLGSDLLVEVLHPVLGLFGAMWLICAATAGLTALGAVLLARVANPRSAATLPWALLFVFNFPFLWGFINYALAAAVAVLMLTAWIALAERPSARSALLLVATPAVFICHAVGGVLLVAMIVGYEVAALGRPAGFPRLARAVAAPIVSLLATLLAWRALAGPGGGMTVWLPYRKVEAVAMMLRDQNLFLDGVSVAACGVVAVLGWRWGAVLRRGNAGPVMAAAMLFVLTPSLLAGSDRIDTRLAPAVALLGFALLDWSGVEERSRRIVAVAGAVLLAVRFAVTTFSFVEYGRSYTSELTALQQVRPGTRVLNLTLVDCAPHGWRMARLEHLANLATPLRHAWVNAHWAIGGVQLLTIRQAPDAGFAADPSQLVWPDHCIDHRLPYAQRDRHGLVETLPHLPLERIDYLWIIGEAIPPSARDPRLRQVWGAGMSALYLVTRTPPATEALDTAAGLAKRPPSDRTGNGIGRVAQR